MKLLRPLVILLILLFALAALFWWSRITKVDMAQYAPADALVYVEVDSLTDVIKAFQTSDAWTTVASKIGINSNPQSHWGLVASRAGLAPTEAVLSSRAQVALVVVGLNTTEKDDSLKVKPEVALIVETHTSKWRMKSVAISSVKKLADFAYGTSICSERTADVDYVECTDQSKSRKIIGAIDGTVLTIGNSDKAIQSCLEVHRGTRPSLLTDPELLRLKTSLKSNSALSFGYVSQLNAARLISIVGPLLMGKSPGDQQLGQLLSNSSSKILRGVAWTSNQVGGSIEDHYQISLDPEVVRHLEPAFSAAVNNEDFWKLVPSSFRSVSVYKNQAPLAAWASLNSAVAMRLDTVSSVIFSALLKSSLSTYGIDDPKAVLSSMESPLVTIRPTIGEGSLLIAKVKNDEQLKHSLSNPVTQILSSSTAAVDKNKEFVALLINGFVVLGKTEDMAIYLDQLKNNELVSAERVNELERSKSSESGAIVTYNNDRSSLLTIVKALSLLQGRKLSSAELDSLANSFSKSDFSVVESSLSSNGIERTTHSAFGQFGTLLSFAQADSSEASR